MKKKRGKARASTETQKILRSVNCCQSINISGEKNNNKKKPTRVPCIDRLHCLMEQGVIK